ncbi:MAG: hypothetical protein H6737_28690 [Alphaproteobacteria bacterium]|nr:hypothetical protein [Alphaproteobacteria bacterium]
MRPAPLAVLLVTSACKGDRPAPPMNQPDIYEIPEGWPTEGDPWASFTVRSGCTQVGDNGDTYTYDAFGWPLTGAAGDGAWSFEWTYERVDGRVTGATQVEVFGDSVFTTEYTYDESQIVEDERSQGEISLECRHEYYDVGLSRESTCTLPSLDEIVTTYDWCNQARELRKPGPDPTLEVTYAGPCELASIVEIGETGGVPLTITRTFEAGRESTYVFDRNGTVTTIAYTWTCE